MRERLIYFIPRDRTQGLWESVQGIRGKKVADLQTFSLQNQPHTNRKDIIMCFPYSYPCVIYHLFRWKSYPRDHVSVRIAIYNMNTHCMCAIGVRTTIQQKQGQCIGLYLYPWWPSIFWTKSYPRECFYLGFAKPALWSGSALFPISWQIRHILVWRFIEKPSGQNICGLH